MSAEEKDDRKSKEKKELEEFHAACLVAKRLMESGELRVRIIYPSRVDLQVGKEDLERSASEEGVEPAGCRRILNSEVAPLMAAVLSGDNSIVMMLASLRAGRLEEDFDAAASHVRKRRDMVAKEVVVQRLRDRYLLKQTSKTSPLSGWHWEISTKEFDDRAGRLAGMRHATVRLHAHRRTGRYEEGWSDYIPAMFQAQAVEAFAFDCDLEEAEELRDAFERIVAELKSVQEAHSKKDEREEQGGAGHATG